MLLYYLITVYWYCKDPLAEAICKTKQRIMSNVEWGFHSLAFNWTKCVGVLNSSTLTMCWCWLRSPYCVLTWSLLWKCLLLLCFELSACGADTPGWIFNAKMWTLLNFSSIFFNFLFISHLHCFFQSMKRQHIHTHTRTHARTRTRTRTHTPQGHWRYQWSEALKMCWSSPETELPFLLTQPGTRQPDQGPIPPWNSATDLLDPLIHRRTREWWREGGRKGRKEGNMHGRRYGRKERRGGRMQGEDRKKGGREK